MDGLDIIQPKGTAWKGLELAQGNSGRKNRRGVSFPVAATIRKSLPHHPEEATEAVCRFCLLRQV